MNMVKQKLNGEEKLFPFFIFETESRRGIAILFLSSSVLIALGLGVKPLWAVVPGAYPPPM